MALARPRVFLADNHEAFLNAEMTLLRPHFDLVGSAFDGASLVAGVQELRPDVVVVDVNMPVMTGIEAVERLVAAGSSAKFVFLTVHNEDEFVQACLKGGRRGYVWKSRMKAHLIPAIESVLSDREYVSPRTNG
jgi:DNA-binding NarL/FixJ family response regulator